MCYYKILFILFFSSVLVFPSHHTVVLTPSVTSHYYYCDDGTYGSSNNISYGGSQTQHHYTYESVYKFSFAGLPSNTCNISATLESYKISGTISGNIVKVTDNLEFGNYSACYLAVNNGAIIFSVDNVSGQQHDVSSYFGSTIDPNGNINFGVAPAVPNGTANISIKLKINYDLLFDVTFQNTFISVGNGGTIIVNGTQYNSPAVGFKIPEGDYTKITGAAQDQTISAIDYVFSGWFDSPASNANLISSVRSHDFYPGGNTAYYAHFIGTPNVTTMNVQNNIGVVGSNPTLTWTDNVNSNVSYKIYRQVKNGGVWGTRYFLCNVNPGVKKFIDKDLYQVSGNNWDFVLIADAYYNTEQTARTGGSAEFDANWFINPGKRNFGNKQIETITEYKLYDNFPNPFNPSTVISFQMPNDGNVKLKVYNMMGQEVMTLVNEFKEKGMYNITFNAGKLASGMYIYKLEAGSFVQVKKMLLTK